MGRVGASSSPVLRVAVLGGFRLAYGAHALDAAAWRLRRARALVKLLALAPGHRLHREQVYDAFWPESPPELAATSLRYALHVARRTLARLDPELATCLLLRDDHLTFRADLRIEVDADVFEAAAARARASRAVADYESAIGLYTGDVLPEDRYEDWAAGPREQLRELYLALLADLAERYERAGEAACAIQTLSHLVERDPLREEAHVDLIRLYAATGQRHQALRQYRRLEQALARALRAEPSAATRRLRDEVLALPPPTRAPAPPPGRAAAPPIPGLPAALTSLVGRDADLQQVQALLQAHRLITLMGPGGVGKTRLAIQTAVDAADRFSDGVWFVDLTAVAEGGLVAREVMSALELWEDPSSPFETSLVRFLSGRRVLLVLDNCEHLVVEVARLAEILLRACPDLRILATSRQALGVVGEAVWQVPPLATPPPGAGASAADLETFGALRLFLERARLVAPGFALAGEVAPVVAEICRRLDGLPLAIELAAARVRVLAVAQIAARLDDRFRLLAGSGAGAPARHRALQAVVDWSYDLLDLADRELFDRLSVFAAGWTLEAAEAVRGPTAAGDVLEGLTRLIDRSLVLVGPVVDGEARYGLLETLREYGARRLRAGGHEETALQRHARFFLGLAERAEPGLRGPDQQIWLRRVECDHDNLRAALAFTLQRRRDCVQVAGALGWFWYLRGHVSEGRRWLESALDAEPMASPHWRARALRAAATLARLQGDYRQAADWFEASRALCQDVDDRWGSAMARAGLGLLEWRRGDYPRAAALCGESLRALRTLGDDWATSTVLNHLGRIARAQGEPDRAAPLHREALGLQRAIGDARGIAETLHNLGHVEHARGAFARADAFHAESLGVRRDLGDRWGVFECLEGLAIAAAAQGQWRRAAALFGAAEALRESLGGALPLAQVGEYDEAVAAARAALGAAGFTDAWQAGRALPFDRVVEVALCPGATPS